MDTNVQKLVETLRSIEQDTTITKTVPDEIKSKDGGFYEHDLPEKVQEAVALACDYLIGSDGSCNFQNMKVLKEAGFNVTCGESDGFGWLSGVIHTSKGTIIYG